MWPNDMFTPSAPSLYIILAANRRLFDNRSYFLQYYYTNLYRPNILRTNPAGIDIKSNILACIEYA